jgi:hypothetical protein
VVFLCYRFDPFSVSSIPVTHLILKELPEELLVVTFDSLLLQDLPALLQDNRPPLLDQAFLLHVADRVLLHVRVLVRQALRGTRVPVKKRDRGHFSNSLRD